MVDPGLFSDVHKGNCTCKYRHSLYSSDWGICRFFSELVCLPNVGVCQSRQITNIFPSDSRKPKIFTCKYRYSLYSSDWGICRSFSEPVCLPNVGVCQSRQIMNIFPSDSRKPKIFTCNYIRMSQCKFFLLLNVRNPPNFNKE